MIKPIETIYKGYKFRSRLEARWAFFFDLCEIPYRYESEGYVLEDGTYYFPDFYLPWFHAFVEIKPSKMDADERKEAIRKCELLGKKDGCIILFCEGDPYEENIHVYCHYEKNGLYGGVRWFESNFYVGAWYAFNTQTTYAGYSGGKRHITLSAKTYNKVDTYHFFDSKRKECSVDQFERMTNYRDDLKSCAMEARQARFEHGETPNTF